MASLRLAKSLETKSLLCLKHRVMLSKKAKIIGRKHQYLLAMNSVRTWYFLSKACKKEQKFHKRCETKLKYNSFRQLALYLRYRKHRKQLKETVKATRSQILVKKVLAGLDLSVAARQDMNAKRTQADLFMKEKLKQ
jgi:hypothetical protein